MCLVSRARRFLAFARSVASEDPQNFSLLNSWRCRRFGHDVGRPENKRFGGEGEGDTAEISRGFGDGYDEKVTK